MKEDNNDIVNQKSNEIINGKGEAKEDDNSKDKVYPPYKYEIELIRNKKFDPDLITKIRNQNK